MIAILPPHRSIGKIEIVEVYVYFDGPKLFTCVNGAGQLFLGLWTSDDESADTYLLAPVTQSRFVAVRSGALSLLKPFQNPEIGYLLEYKVRHKTAETAVTPLLPEQVDPDVLPESDQFLRYSTDTLPVRFADLDLRTRANATQREVLGLHLHFANATREEAPTGGLGKVLTGLQESIDAIGQQINGEPTTSGVIPPAVLNGTMTHVVQAGGGSFALEIVADKSVDLFKNALITDAIRRFIELVAAGSSFDELKELLTRARPRAASKYKKFLASLVSSDASLTMSWFSPDETRNRGVELPLSAARDALRAAKQITEDEGERKAFIGYFEGIDLPRQTFLAIEEGGLEFRGKFLISAREQAAHITIQRRYFITLREIIEVDITGDERLRYELESIGPVQEEELSPA